MAPKKKGGKEKDDLHEVAERLPGVLVVDWLGGGFGELGVPLPLLPLCGVSLLEVWLTQLSGAGCEDVLVLTGRDGPALTAFIEGWRKRVFTKAKVRVLEFSGCGSVGDAMRELERQRLLTTDFLLMCGTSVVDTDLSKLVADHSARRKRDKEAIYTKLLCPSPEGQLPPWERLQVAFNGSTQELLQCCTRASELVLSPQALKELFKPRADCAVQARFDLVDTHVAMCGPEVLEKFTENFDVQELGAAFTQVVLDAKFEDLVSSQGMHLFFPAPCYFARVDDPRTLFATSVAVLRSAKKQPIFASCFPDLAGRAKPNTCLGPVEGLEARECFIDASASIPKGAKVERSIILAGVTLGEETEVEDSLLGPNVVIKDGACVYQSLLGDGATVEEDETLLGGRAGVGEDARPKQYGTAALIGADVEGLWEEIAQLRAEAEDVEEEDEAGGDSFVREIVGMLNAASKRFDRGDSDRSGLAVELRSLRLAEHKTCVEMLEQLVPLLMQRVVSAAENAQPLIPVAKQWLPMIAEFSVKNSRAEGACALRIVERVCREHPKLGAEKFALILGTISDSGVIPDEVAFEWYASASESVKQLSSFLESNHVQKYLEYLRQESESGSDSGSDSD